METYLDVSPEPEGSLSTPDMVPMEVECEVESVSTPDIQAELNDSSIDEKVLLQKMRENHFWHPHCIITRHKLTSQKKTKEEQRKCETYGMAVIPPNGATLLTGLLIRSVPIKTNIFLLY